MVETNAKNFREDKGRESEEHRRDKTHAIWFIPVKSTKGSKKTTRKIRSKVSLHQHLYLPSALTTGTNPLFILILDILSEEIKINEKDKFEELLFADDLALLKENIEKYHQR